MYAPTSAYLKSPAGLTRGLRREEVAYLAGVSVTWYTWLEQGRDVTPSRQVVDSLARTLRLSHAEHVYLSALAGHSAPQPAEDPSPGTVPAHVQRLLDALADYPALVIAPDWAILAWNAVYEALYPNVATVAAADRNFLWLLFTDPYLRVADAGLGTHRPCTTSRRFGARPVSGLPSRPSPTLSVGFSRPVKRSGPRGKATTSRRCPHASACSATPKSATFTWSNIAWCPRTIRVCAW